MYRYDQKAVRYFGNTLIRREPLTKVCVLIRMILVTQERTVYELIWAYALIKSNKFKNKTRFRMDVAYYNNNCCAKICKINS